MFKRSHHQYIAGVLLALNGPLLKECCCWFGGGTAIALRYGEYRESVDIDFLVSDIGCYRQLRTLMTGLGGIRAILRDDAGSLPQLQQVREIRADQYGIRTMLEISGRQIKFEIVLEGRIILSLPGPNDEICGITTLAPLDMVAGKLLANSDRWADEGVFNRDLIDLTMMQPEKKLLRAAINKTQEAYGMSIVQDCIKAIDKLQSRPGWLEHCMKVLAMDTPKALLWERLVTLKRKIESQKRLGG